MADNTRRDRSLQLIRSPRPCYERVHLEFLWVSQSIYLGHMSVSHTPGPQPIVVDIRRRSLEAG